MEYIYFLEEKKINCSLASLPRWETFIYFNPSQNEVVGKKEQKNLSNLFELFD